MKKFIMAALVATTTLFGISGTAFAGPFEDAVRTYIQQNGLIGDGHGHGAYWSSRISDDDISTFSVPSGLTGKSLRWNTQKLKVINDAKAAVIKDLRNNMPDYWERHTNDYDFNGGYARFLDSLGSRPSDWRLEKLKMLERADRIVLDPVYGAYNDEGLVTRKDWERGNRADEFAHEFQEYRETVAAELVELAGAAPEGGYTLEEATRYEEAYGLGIDAELIDSLRDGRITASELRGWASALSRSFFTKEEFYRNVNLDGLKKAHDAGWTGKGIDVLVWGADSHQIQGDNYNAAALVGFIAPGANVTTRELIPGRYHWSDFQNNDVIVRSYDSRWPDWITVSDGFRNTLENSPATIVVGAGSIADSGFSQCNRWTGTLGYCNSLGRANVRPDNLIYVGAVNSDNSFVEGTVKSGRSNQRNFIVAETGSVYGRNHLRTTYNAAARVGGAAALVRQKFNTNAENTASILLETADGLGRCAGVAKSTSCTDEEYGHGKLNLNAALAPIGSLK